MSSQERYIDSQVNIKSANIRLWKSGMVCAYVSPEGKKRDELIEYSHRARTYKVKKAKVVSSVIRMWEKKGRSKMYFVTITLAGDYKEKDAARIFGNVCKNLKLNYGIKEYTWVKENQTSGRKHYHIIFTGNWINPETFQSVWNVAVRNYDNNLAISNNSVRYGYNVVVKTPNRAANYAAKYAAKGKGVHEQKAYATTIPTEELFRNIEFEELEAISVNQVKNIIEEKWYIIVTFKNYIDTSP